MSRNLNVTCAFKRAAACVGTTSYPYGAKIADFCLVEFYGHEFDCCHACARELAPEGSEVMETLREDAAVGELPGLPKDHPWNTRMEEGYEPPPPPPEKYYGG